MKQQSQTPNSSKRLGFTIVELLIVIVIIGVLAGIVTVAYSGIRDKAIDVRRAAALDQYVKIVTIYKISNGYFPATTSGNDAACLGGASDYPASGFFPEGVCYTEGGSRNIKVNDDFNSEIQTVTGSLPAATQTPALFSENSGARGAWYIPMTDDKATIVYYDTSSNGQHCPHGKLMASEGDNISVCSIAIE